VAEAPPPAPPIALTRAALSVDALVAHVAAPEHGATVTFTGTTRREAEGHEVVALEYEAYEPMALREMEAIAQEAGRRYGARVALAHRLGRVAVGEASVAIAAAAGHRAEAFAACRHAIDEVKRRVPIWKQSVHADGARVWQDGMPPVTTTS